MIFGGYGAGGETLPRVIHLGISRFRAALPRRGESLDFLVAIHEEGTGITWQRNARLGLEIEADLLAAVGDLHAWSLGLALTPGKARQVAAALGTTLHDVFIGQSGDEYLAGVTPTAILLSVDETVINLPWELLRSPAGAAALETPFGRLVSTRIVPRPGRDPASQDREVRILAVINPTADLAEAEGELRALTAVEGDRTPFRVQVDVVERNEATRARFATMLAPGDYDIVHFAGHAGFDPRVPGTSAIRLADGLLTSDEVPRLGWKAPPGLVFNSACESGRGAAGRRLVGRDGHGNGLAAAFLAAGTAAYAGYFWPVTDVGAARFTAVFYRTLFERENVGLAFLEARRDAVAALEADGDLTGYSAILFGDAASKHRRDLATAA